MTFEPKPEQRAEFEKYFNMSAEERRALGLTTWGKIYEKVGVNPKTGIRWREKLQKGKIDAGEIDVNTLFAEDRLEYVTLLRGMVQKPDCTSGMMKLYGDLIGIYKGEDSGKFEISIDDRYAIALSIVDDLRGKYKNTGDCPVCGRCELLRGDIRVDQGREQQEEGPLEPVELPDGPEPDTDPLSGD